MRFRAKKYKILFWAIISLFVFIFNEELIPKNSDSNFFSSERIRAQVAKVVDGDTIDVLINAETKRVRLIGINTPETVDPRKEVECFGLEASRKAKEVLNGKKVFLENDPTQGDADKYGRLLRYVFLEDETNFNLLMIREGYAYEYTYDIPYRYQNEFDAAEREAASKKSGLWRGCKN
jgi:micrococcal nuclease